MKIQFVHEKEYVITKTQRTYLYKFADIIGHNKIEVVPPEYEFDDRPCTDFLIGKFRVMGDQDNPHTWYIVPEDGLYTFEAYRLQWMIDHLLECEDEDEDGELVLYVM